MFDVLVLMGSKSDWEVMQNCTFILAKLKVPFQVHVASAHRTPDKVEQLVREAEAASCKVIIAAAGGAAHLAGVVASKTLLPVLGVPLKGWALDGLDALLSTVQMPAGMPVATFAIGKVGAINAALFAAQFLGTTSPEKKQTFAAYRKEQTQQVLDSDDLPAAK